ncbi:MAG TPA: hypothetical protein PLY66_10495 [Acidobacteriota bacterium]|nr:hypothetical protein [Acidobacteriota bacterium]HQF87063.1 hypothetical protein [Acidobacteriota bacterium]HQG91624.1 hypothetical protein [Acidobacteriota bacterium]HQK86387.1 hypothetical protein [Acidobacteriota bacterium]
MGIKELWQRYQQGQVQRRLNRLSRRLREKYSQGYERIAAAEELDAIPGDEAIFLLLGRFDVLVPKISEDEEERRYVCDLIRAKGATAVPAILRYIREKENLTYPLRLLAEIVGRDEARRMILDILTNEFSPEYDRAPHKKMAIIQALVEDRGEAVVTALMPFLRDPNDDVVISAAEVLAAQPGAEEVVRSVFLDLLTEEEEKPRIKRKIAELLKDHRWKVTGYRRKVEDSLPEGFYLDKKGFVKQLGES